MAVPSSKSLRSQQVTARSRVPLPPRYRQARPVVAVLPFLDLRPEGAEEPLAEGLAEEILQALNELEGLQVISRTTSFLYGRSGLPLAEVGRRLQANAILGGSILPQGERLTIRAELMAVATEQGLWTQTFGFDRKDLFPTLDTN